MPPLSEEDRELIRRFCPDRDPLVPEFSDVRNLDSAYAEGREDELLECREHGDGDVVESMKGIVFRDLPTLRRWLQEYSVKRKGLSRLGILMFSIITQWCATRQIVIGGYMLGNRRSRESLRSQRL